jgi:hypothetical protein
MLGSYQPMHIIFYVDPHSTRPTLKPLQFPAFKQSQDNKNGLTATEDV